MVFKNRCVLVLWAKVALELEGLNRSETIFISLKPEVYFIHIYMEDKLSSTAAPLYNLQNSMVFSQILVHAAHVCQTNPLIYICGCIKPFLV